MVGAFQGTLYYYSRPQSSPSHIASPIIILPPTGPSDIVVTKSFPPGPETTITPGDTYPGGSVVPYTITLRKIPGGDPIQSLTIDDCMAGQPVTLNVASANPAVLPPPPPEAPASPACNDVGTPNPRGLTWIFNSSLTPPGPGYVAGHNQVYIDQLNAGATVNLYFSVTANNVDACFDNVVYGKGYTSGGDEIQVGTANTSTCISAPRYPYLNTNSGDVHAGGSPGTGSACGGTGTVNGQGGYSKGQYVVSAGAAVGNFGSNNDPAPGRSLTFSNNGGSPGYYGSLCRADLAAAAANYQAANPGFVSIVPAASVPAALASAINGQLIITNGPVTLGPTIIDKRVTLLVIGGDVTLTGPVSYSSASYASLAQLPAFGLIASGGSINIEPSVQSLVGFYYSTGTINTCFGPNIGGGEASLCANSLVVNGLMSANNFKFRRTGTVGVIGYQETETINFGALLYLATPPAFSDVTSRPRFNGERPPLY